jgi:phenylalanyl-tRNA synthetase beta chain
MKVPLSWIKEFIDTDLTPTQIAKLLTMAGLEVDGIEKTAGGFSGVVVGRVVAVEKHPQADKLQIATVSDGEQNYQVVCGAPNCRPGIKTAFAKIDAKLGDITVQKANLRGVESYGMLCSGKELGLSDNHEAIIEFEEHLKEGSDVAEWYSDAVFEISLTPNLAHCNSVLGVVRELSAVTGLPYRLPEVEVNEGEGIIEQLVDLVVKDKKRCPRYACRLIRNVQVAPSPHWLQQRVTQCGYRPVNNVVDATNYVMHGLGQPLHAFDFDLIEGKRIIVRSAHKNEAIKTLDSKERILSEEDLVICDAKGPVAIAGVMGGISTEVGNSAKNILIESAYFDPSSIRRTSRRLGLKSDASKRFERGTDPNQTIPSLDLVAQLIQQLAGGEIALGAYDEKERDFLEKDVTCRLSHINQVLGTHLGVQEVETLFEQLGFDYNWDGRDLFSVSVPTYRVDIHEEIDLIEEVARIYGYDKIVKSKPAYRHSKLEDTPIYGFERAVRERLIAEGLQEFVTCDLIGPAQLDLLQDSMMPPDATIKVLNPVSIEQSILRTSLIPCLLNLVKENVLVQNRDVAGFEIGRIHFMEKNQVKEQVMAGMIVTGKRDPHHFDQKSSPFDFYDLKGIIENLFAGLNIPEPDFRLQQLNAFHPGRQAAIYIDDVDVGTAGEIHPSILRTLDVDQRIYFAEINLHDLFQKRKADVRMQELPRYPGSERDWTITLDKSVPMGEIFEAIRAVATPLLTKVSLLDIYWNEKLGNSHNVTLRFYYRDKSKTLSQQEVEAEHERIVQESGISK